MQEMEIPVAVKQPRTSRAGCCPDDECGICGGSLKNNYYAGKRLTPDTFRARMDAQRESGTLRSLEETPLGTTVQLFGNVAVVLSAFEARVNGGGPGRGVNAYLCVKDGGAWKIVAVAWDNESATAPLPPVLARAPE